MCGIKSLYDNKMNLQNIPSKNHDIRKMFTASMKEYNTDIEDDNSLLVYKWDEVITSKGWKCANNIKIGDELIIDCEAGTEQSLIVERIEDKDDCLKFICS